MRISNIYRDMTWKKKPHSGRSAAFIFVLFFVSGLFFALVQIIPRGMAADIESKMLAASRLMEVASSSLQQCRREQGIPIDERNDPNRTGLIGMEISSTTTSLGSLEAKRTTTNPNFAGLFVYLFHQAKIRRGDTVAVGASGSFPALLTAAVSAAKVMELTPVIICSLGASQWGANHPEFHLLDMLSCLRESGILTDGIQAVSLGGDQDIGGDMDEEGRRLLLNDIKQTGFPMIHESDLKKNVALRMEKYFPSGVQSPVKAFINIGGSWANMGTDSQVLSVRPGLVRNPPLPDQGKRGVLHEMAARGIPIIHCLYIKGLADRYGLSWDPTPLPEPGSENIFRILHERQPLFALISIGYLAVLILIVVLKLRSDRKRSLR